MLSTPRRSSAGRIEIEVSWPQGDLPQTRVSSRDGPSGPPSCAAGRESMMPSRYSPPAKQPSRCGFGGEAVQSPCRTRRTFVGAAGFRRRGERRGSQRAAKYLDFRRDAMLPAAVPAVSRRGPPARRRSRASHAHRRRSALPGLARLQAPTPDRANQQELPQLRAGSSPAPASSAGR